MCENVIFVGWVQKFKTCKNPEKTVGQNSIVTKLIVLISSVSKLHENTLLEFCAGRVMDVFTWFLSFVLEGI